MRGSARKPLGELELSAVLGNLHHHMASLQNVGAIALPSFSVAPDSGDDTLTTG